jgi:hypothetical protein
MQPAEGHSESMYPTRSVSRAALIRMQLIGWDPNTHRHLAPRFLCGEGSHSRRYGRTAALRLLVQACDGDEEKDDQLFFYFSK